MRTPDDRMFPDISSESGTDCAGPQPDSSTPWRWAIPGAVAGAGLLLLPALIESWTRRAWTAGVTLFLESGALATWCCLVAWRRQVRQTQQEKRQAEEEASKPWATWTGTAEEWLEQRFPRSNQLEDGEDGPPLVVMKKRR